MDMASFRRKTRPTLPRFKNAVSIQLLLFPSTCDVCHSTQQYSEPPVILSSISINFSSSSSFLFDLSPGETTSFRTV
jgi:hypothetical protein